MKVSFLEIINVFIMKKGGGNDLRFSFFFEFTF